MGRTALAVPGALATSVWRRSPAAPRGKRGGTIGRRVRPINAACWDGITHRAAPPAPVIVLLRDQVPPHQGRNRNSRGSAASDQFFRRDRMAVRSRSARGPDNPDGGPLQTWFRFRHLRERRAGRHRKDKDTVMALPVPVHASRVRNCRYAKDADITSPWRTGLQVDTGPRLRRASGGGCSWSWSGTGAHVRPGDRGIDCGLGSRNVWTRFGTRSVPGRNRALDRQTGLPGARLEDHAREGLSHESGAEAHEPEPDRQLLQGAEFLRRDAKHFHVASV